MTTSKSLWQRINEVRRTNPYIKKDKKVGEGGGYMAVTHDHVTAELRDDLIERGVLVFPSIVLSSEKVVPTGTSTAKGVPFIRFEAVFNVAFVNVDNPVEREVVTLPAHAIDQGDKAPGKAISYAQKYALLKMFNIETGEEDESRSEERGEQGGMPEGEFDDWQAAIDALATGEDPNVLWKKILASCEKHNDRASVTKLRAYLTAKVSKLKKKGESGAERS